MTPSELQAIKGRWAKATPGPWFVENGEIVKPINDGERLFLVVGNEVDEDGFVGEFVMSSADAQAIANAPTDIADLLAEVERLQAENLSMKCCGNCRYFMRSPKTCAGCVMGSKWEAQ